MRVFIAVVVVCVVAFAAAAWWFQWWNVSTSPSEDGNKTEVRLSVDKDKVKRDLAAAQKRITRGVHKDEGSGGTEKAPSRGQPVEGTIETVDPGKHSFTVMTKEDGEVTVRTDADTRIRVGDHEGTLADLRVGDRAAMTYEAAVQEGAAKTVTVEKRS